MSTPQYLPRLCAGVAFATLVSVLHAQADKWPDPEIKPPNIPAHTFNVNAYGADASGSTLTTQALQRTIDEAGAAGGGIVEMPAGKYLSAALHLANGVNLHLAKGATLQFTDQHDQYKMEKNRYENLLVADGLHDIAITGEGTIDGNGKLWWSEFAKVKGKAEEKTAPHRPFMIVLTKCDRVLIQGVTLANSPMFHLVPGQCNSVTIDGITITAPENASNTDAIDPSGWNYLIKNCTFDTGDDCIAIKATKPEGDRVSCEDFLVENCTFKHGHGMSIGGQTPGGLKRLTVRDNTFENTEAGIRMKAPRGNGGPVEDCLYENLTMKNVKYPIYITSYYPERTAPKEKASDDPAKPVTATTPIWKKITIRNVTSTDSPQAGRMIGLAEMPISDVLLENVKITADKGMDLWNCQNVKFVNSMITASKGPALNVQESKQISGIDPKSGKASTLDAAAVSQ